MTESVYLPIVRRFETNPIFAVMQAQALGRLVAQNKEWLPQSPFAGTAHRYGRGLIRATLHTMRTAKDPRILAYTLLEKGVVGSRYRGIATAIPNQSVSIPGTDTLLRGVDIAMWLDSETSEHAKSVFAHKFMEKALRDVSDPDSAGRFDAETFFSTQVDGAHGYNDKLTASWIRHTDTPSTITSTEPDIYGVSAQTAHLYSIDWAKATGLYSH